MAHPLSYWLPLLAKDNTNTRVRGPRTRPETYLQNEQGKTFAFLTARRLTPDVQKLIWADVTTNYYRRFGDDVKTNYYRRRSTLDPGFFASVIQAAVRRLQAIIGGYNNINFSMLAAKNRDLGRLRWQNTFDNLHERRMNYRVATSPKWRWGLVGQYETPMAVFPTSGNRNMEFLWNNSY